MPSTFFDPLSFKYKFVFLNICVFSWTSLFTELSIKYTLFLIYFNNGVLKMKIIALSVGLSIKM